MSTLNIEGKLINLEQVHFVRRESPQELLVSFGTDFLRFKGTSERLDDIYYKIDEALNEKLSSSSRR
jgi:ABC-type bacteriocin/lantibiotic exporter with double-glycine peptidase domain